MIFEEPNIVNNKYTFIIDGNYLAMRIAFAIGLDFKTDPKKHSKEYTKALCQSTANLINTYKDSIDKVMVVMDLRSWRKDIKMIVPSLYSHMTQEESQYKANRVKDEDGIDLKVAMDVFKEFVKMLDEKFNIPLITTEGAEGDDLLYIVSKKEVESGRKCLLYTSDGDISQLISNDIYVLKQMPRDKPNKIIVSESKLEELYPKGNCVDDGLHIFGGNSISNSDLLLNKFSEDDTMTINAAEFLFIKAFSGDKKDNIHPTFLWRSVDSSGKNKEYKPTKMYIKSGLKSLDMTLSDLKLEHLYDDEFSKKLLKSTLKSTPIYPKLVDVTRQYKSNIKAIIESGVDIKPFNMVINAICGIGEGVVPAFECSDENGEIHTPNVAYTEKILKQITSENITLKEVKSVKFPKPMLMHILKSLPYYRNVGLLFTIFKQNVEMLHLNDMSIPKYVIEGGNECYEKNKDIKCDMSTVTSSHALLASTNSSDGIFDGISGADVAINDSVIGNSGEIEKIDLDSEDILSTIFGDIGGL